MRVLVLVLMSSGFPYDSFREIWKRYRKSHPNVDCYFYRGNPNLSTDYLLDDDTLWIRISDSHSDIFERTIRAFRYFVNERRGYSFLFRANASCILDFNKYYEMCKEFPTKNFCSAEILRRGKIIEHPVIEAPSGAGYTLSMDVVKRFAREDRLRNVVIDDISIGYYLQEWGIPIVETKMYKVEQRPYSHEELQEVIKEHFHIRFKTSQRLWDISAMELVSKLVYK